MHDKGRLAGSGVAWHGSKTSNLSALLPLDPCSGWTVSQGGIYSTQDDRMATVPPIGPRGRILVESSGTMRGREQVVGLVGQAC